MDTEIEDSRTAERFVIEPPIAGHFGSVSLTVLNISATGLQCEHSDPVKIGTRARLVVVVPPDPPAAVRGRVVWSRLSKTPNAQGKYLYRSGINIDEELEIMQKVLRQLLGSNVARTDEKSLERKRSMMLEKEKAKAHRSLVKPIIQPEIPPDQVLLVQQAFERLKTNPDEALKWYNRAKFSLSTSKDPSIHYREDVLAVWESLERTVELSTISKVFEKNFKQ